MADLELPALFIGDHLAVDFLNSIASPRGEPHEWIASGSGLVEWLVQAGAISREAAKHFRTEASAAELDSVARKAREFREWLRTFLAKQAGNPQAERADRDLAPLNQLLSTDDSHLQVVWQGPPTSKDRSNDKPYALRRVGGRKASKHLLQPIADAAAELICQEDMTLLRTCEGPDCTLMFLDRSKAHARRWCSMTLCGNRAKAAAYRARSARP
jgi:predicted RNA-binding Zn ribbon-like protein